MSLEELKKEPAYWFNGNKVSKTKMDFLCTRNPIYEKPEIIKLTRMNFPIRVINKHAGNTPDTICRQCSSCHNCR